MPSTSAIAARKRAQRIRKTKMDLAIELWDARHRIELLEKSKRYSDEHKQAKIAEIREELSDAVDTIEKNAGRVLSRAKDAATPKTTLPENSGKALLLETQRARVWQEQIKPHLDGGGDPVEIAQRLATQDNRLAIQVLNENLKSYLSLQSQTQGENQFAQDRRADRYQEAIRETEMQVWSDEEREAHEGLKDVERAHGHLETNLGLIRREIEGGEATRYLFSDDGDLDLEEDY